GRGIEQFVLHRPARSRELFSHVVLRTGGTGRRIHGDITTFDPQGVLVGEARGVSFEFLDRGGRGGRRGRAGPGRCEAGRAGEPRGAHDRELGAAAMRASATTLLEDALALAHALIAHDAPAPPRLCLVTRGTWVHAGAPAHSRAEVTAQHASGDATGLGDGM